MRANTILVLAALLAGCLTGQTTGRIEGVVRDPSGTPAPGTALEIVETGTGAERRVGTDDRGWYLAPGLAPGLYEISATHDGFRGEIRRGVELAAGQSVRVDLLLQLGETRESVVVTGQASPLSAAPSDWGGVIEQRKLESLPLNGRDLFDLAVQQTGAMVATTAYKTLTTGQGIRVSVNGARPAQNSFRMDGIYINNASAAAPSSAAGRLLGLESVQELRLVSSPFDAEFGRAGGAVFTAVSKSGSNEWHGDAYEYLRNAAFDAKNFFDSPTERIPPLRKNQFGGLLGGPLRHNRLFFMTNYEGIRLASGQTLSSVVPTAEAREGHLPGRTVEVSPLILPYLNLYPLPNGQDYGDGTGAFNTLGITPTREDYVTGKLDAVASNRWRFATRYTYDDAVSHRPDPVEVFSFLDDSHYHFLHTETQFLQSPNTIHTFRAGLSRVWNQQDVERSAALDALAFVPGQKLGLIDMGAAATSIGGTSGDSVALMPRRFVTNNFQLNYTLTHIRGAHTLRLGGSFDRVQFNRRVDRNTMGTYKFTSLVGFLQARPSSGDVALPGSDVIRGWRQSIFSGFIQDEFRASERLSLSLGVRYEAYSVPSEVNGKVSTIRDLLNDTSLSVGGPLFKNPSKTNFAPRASIAFQPFSSGKTVIRAGAGIFYDLLSTQEIMVAGALVPPFFNIVSMNNPPFPNLLEAAQNAHPESTLDVLEYYVRQPYVAQYQFLVQQELGRDTVVHIGYVGARGVHLPGQISDANPYRPETLANGDLFFPANGVRLNPAFNRTRLWCTRFDSSYNSLQAGVDRRWRAGLRFQLKYVWGKSLDNTSNMINNDYLNSDGVPTLFNLRQNRGRSDFDLQHTFGVNFSWALPRLRGPIAGAILGGWEVHGMAQAQTGPPCKIIVGFDRARMSKGVDPGERPMYIAAPGARVILGDPQRWFDPYAFGLPPAGMYGNLGRNVFDGPGLVNMDLALHKVLWKTERQSVRLRVETFNVANHPNFQIPSGQKLFTSSLDRVGSAGRITETTTTSRQIQLALKWAF